MLSGSQLKEKQVPDKALCIHLFLSPSSTLIPLTILQPYLCPKSPLQSVSPPPSPFGQMTDLWFDSSCV